LDTLDACTSEASQEAAGDLPSDGTAHADAVQAKDAPPLQFSLDITS
jgi:hypothetical protein